MRHLIPAVGLLILVALLFISITLSGALSEARVQCRSFTAPYNTRLYYSSEEYIACYYNRTARIIYATEYESEVWTYHPR